MEPTECSTLEKIHQAAKEEFLAKGFQSASLRHIVKMAGVTTGAFYGYYKSKEALFEALVGEHYQAFLARYQQAHEDFAKLPPQEQTACMTDISNNCMHDLLVYAYDHLDAFKLLLSCAEGTRFAGLLDELVAIEIRSTHEYQAVLESLGHPSPPIDPHLEHILTTGMLNTFFELILHEMPLERAENYLATLQAFYTAGWMKIMGQ